MFKKSFGRLSPQVPKQPKQAPPQRPAPARTIEEDEEEDEEEEYADDQQELGQGLEPASRWKGSQELPGVGTFEGPRSWDQVDTGELGRIAVLIVHAAMPSTEAMVEASACLAAEAAKVEAPELHLDPLGMGSLDPASLALVPADAGQGLSTTRGRSMAMTDFRRRSISGAGGMDSSDLRKALRAGLKPPLASTPQLNLKHLKGQVLLTSDRFHPQAYLGRIHWETSLGQLHAGLASLKNDLNERTGQLQALVKDNFDRFISCKATIDDIHARLRQNEAPGGRNAVKHSGTPSTRDMMETILEVEKKAQETYGELISRAQQADRIRGVLALLSRYGTLFRLPARIRQANQNREFEKVGGSLEDVLVEYRKARTLWAQFAAKKGIWSSIYAEAEAELGNMIGVLRADLQDPGTGLDRALDAMKLLLSMQAEDIRQAREAGDPFNLYLQAQGQQVHGQLEAAQETHKKRVEALGLSTARNLESEARFQQIEGLREDVVPAVPRVTVDEELEHSAGELQATFIAQLTAILTARLPDFWHLPQGRLAPLAQVSEEAQALLKKSQVEAHGFVREMLDEYCGLVEAALLEISKQPGSHALLLRTVRDAVTGLLQLRKDGPKHVNTTLLQLLLSAVALAVGQLKEERAALLARLPELEDFSLTFRSHRAGSPTTLMPDRLRAVLVRGLGQVAALVQEGARATPLGARHPLDVVSEHSGAIQAAFFEAFTEFADGCEALHTARKAEVEEAEKAAQGKLTWGGASSGQPSYFQSKSLDAPAPEKDAGEEEAAGPGEEPSTREAFDQQLLLLASNCAFLRTDLMPQLTSRYGSILCKSGEGKAAFKAHRDSAVAAINKVEARLVNSYLTGKDGAISGLLAALFHEDASPWGAAPLPAAVRGVVLNAVNELVVIQAQLLECAPLLRDQVIADLATHLVDLLEPALKQNAPEGGYNLGGALQLLAELYFLEGALSQVVLPPEREEDNAFGVVEERLLRAAAKAVSRADPQVKGMDEWLTKHLPLRDSPGGSGKKKGAKSTTTAPATSFLAQSKEGRGEIIVEACQHIATLQLDDCQTNWQALTLA